MLDFKEARKIPVRQVNQVTQFSNALLGMTLGEFNNNGRSAGPEGEIAQAPVNASMLREILAADGVPVTGSPRSAPV